ncbi:hypothetical protein [Streptomyces sp. NPDC088775]|uniref:hypothetical protein n=1 Tax=Streptomyces sp. NPDC088775 TaxID=3365896 RepID=UPI00380A6A9C
MNALATHDMGRRISGHRDWFQALHSLRGSWDAPQLSRFARDALNRIEEHDDIAAHTRRGSPSMLLRLPQRDAGPDPARSRARPASFLAGDRRRRPPWTKLQLTAATATFRTHWPDYSRVDTHPVLAEHRKAYL